MVLIARYYSHNCHHLISKVYIYTSGDNKYITLIMNAAPTTGISFSFVQLYNQSIHAWCVVCVCVCAPQNAWRCRFRSSLLALTFSPTTAARAAKIVSGFNIAAIYFCHHSLVDSVYVSSECKWDCIKPSTWWLRRLFIPSASWHSVAIYILFKFTLNAKPRKMYRKNLFFYCANHDNIFSFNASKRWMITSNENNSKLKYIIPRRKVEFTTFYSIVILFHKWHFTGNV